MFLPTLKLSKGSLEWPLIHVGFDTAVIFPVSLQDCGIRDPLLSTAAAIPSVLDMFDPENCVELECNSCYLCPYQSTDFNMTISTHDLTLSRLADGPYTDTLGWTNLCS